jgi:uncharacterized heparinase superfamily protein
MQCSRVLTVSAETLQNVELLREQLLEERELREIAEQRYRGESRARSRCHVAPALTHFSPDSRT